MILSPNLQERNWRRSNNNLIINEISFYKNDSIKRHSTTTKKNNTLIHNKIDDNRHLKHIQNYAFKILKYQGVYDTEGLHILAKLHGDLIF